MRTSRNKCRAVLLFIAAALLPQAASAALVIKEPGEDAPALIRLAWQNDLTGEQVMQKAIKLIRDGAIISHADSRGRTALMHAAYRDLPELVEILAMSFADVDATDQAGWSALNYAIAAGSNASVAIMLKHDANPTVGRVRPIIQALSANNAIAAIRLYKAGAAYPAMHYNAESFKHILVEGGWWRGHRNS